MNLEKIFEILNDLQRDILICFIIQLPLCYTFMYMYSDFFVHQEFINKIIFAISFDIPLIATSILGSLLVSFIIKRYEIDIIMYVFTGGHIYSFSMSILEKIANNNITILYTILTDIAYVLGIIFVSCIIRFKQQKKHKIDD